jgi:hypothetical protein
VLAYDYPLLGFFWSTFIFFLWLSWFMLLFRVVVDIFRSADLGGVAKAIWVLVVAAVPFLGVFVYLIARGGSMATRDQAQAAARDDAMRDYVRSVSGSSGAADELTKLADLKANGVITDAEFEAQKARVLA